MNFHLKTSLGYIKRAPYQALAAISVLVLTFFVATILLVIVYSSGRIINYFETQPQIIAFLKNDAKAESISSLQGRLNLDGRIKDVKYVSKEEAFEIYKKATSDNPLLGELVNPLIFPASLEFSVTDLSNIKEIITEMKKEQIVESISFTGTLEGEKSVGDVVEKLRTISFYVKTGGLTLVLFLLGVSFLVLILILGMRIAYRKEEVEILQLIGASPGFIRTPIVLEAVYYAFFGVIFGWLLAVILILYATPTLISYFGEINIFPRDTIKLIWLLGAILGIELVIGNLIALTGSLLALGRARRVR